MKEYRCRVKVGEKNRRSEDQDASKVEGSRISLPENERR